MKKILVVGDSHMTALQLAPSVDETFQFEFCTLVNDNSAIPRPAEDFQDFDPSRYRAVVFMPKGSRHIRLGLVRYPIEAFDFHCPEQPGLAVDGSVRLLPALLVQTMLRRLMAPELAFTHTVAGYFQSLDLYQIETPPPPPDDHVLAFPRGFAPMIEAHGVSPFPFRYKLWRMHSRILRANGEKIGLRFIEVPPQSREDSGCLAKGLRRDDPTHGNGAYGELVLAQIRALVCPEAAR